MYIDPNRLSKMAPTLYRAALFVLYQFSIVVGIAFMPVALVARKAGIPVPIGRLLSRIGTAYERADAATTA
jgi:hypothetical protein